MGVSAGHHHEASSLGNGIGSINSQYAESSGHVGVGINGGDGGLDVNGNYDLHGEIGGHGVNAGASVGVGGNVHAGPVDVSTFT